MKKILLVAFLMLFVSVNAQFKNSYRLTENDFKNFLSEIIETKGKPFELKEENKKGGATYYTYVNKDNQSDDLIISTYITEEGASIALETKGVVKWNINKISGKFLSLFPLWQKYVDPNADKVKMSDGGITSSPKNKFFKFYKNANFENFWSLELDSKEIYKESPNAFGIGED